MRQGIATRYMGPTNTKGARIRAIARKRSSLGAEMSLTLPYDYSVSHTKRHTAAAKALAEKLNWHGVWVGGGNPDEDGYQYVCLTDATRPDLCNIAAAYCDPEVVPPGRDEDWFTVEPKEA